MEDTLTLRENDAGIATALASAGATLLCALLVTTCPAPFAAYGVATLLLTTGGSWMAANWLSLW